MEIRFLHRGKTEFDRVVDTLLLLDTELMKEDGSNAKIGKPDQKGQGLSSPHSAEPSYASSSQVAGSEQMIRLLVNSRKLVSACRPGNSEKQISPSSAILQDSKLLLNHPSFPFNVSLQTISAVNLVVQYAPVSLQKQEATQLYAD